ncbi:hypothetical protein BGZ46_002133, partial [Entomortierella lignicola]
MREIFTEQPLLRGANLDDVVDNSSSRAHLDRPAGSQAAGSSPASKSTGIFGRNVKPVVDALDSFENNIYLGTSDGFVLHYVMGEMTLSDSDIPRSRLEKKSALGFGKKVVERILVMPTLKLAIVLCDSTLAFFRLPEFSPLHQHIQPIKGVTAFCEDSAQKGYHTGDRGARLCVTKRRTIQFYTLFENSISEPRELNLPNGALVVTRWDNFVCLADGHDFNLIDTRIGRMIPVLPVVQSATSGSNSTVVRPVCIPIAGDEFLLASEPSSGKTIGIFCTGSGDPVRGTLQWTSYPRALAVEFPYVAALLRGNKIEVHSILDQTLVQTIQLNIEARMLIQGPGIWMSSLAKVLTLQQYSHERSQNDGGKSQQEINRIPSVLAKVLIAGKDSVSALVTTPLVLHADKLLQENLVEEALLLSEKAKATMSAANPHRQRLQVELNYIYQKSGLIYLSETLFDDGFSLLERGKMDPRVVIHMFPDVLQKPNAINQVNLFQGIRDKIAQLGTIKSIIGKTLSASGSEQEAEYGNVLLKNAKDILSQYLGRVRKELITVRGRLELLEAIDTALLGLWVDNNDDVKLRQLLESENSCIEDLSEQKLKQSSKHFALSIWYKARKNYKETLSIWKRLFVGELEDKAFDIDLKEMSTLLMSIQDVALVEEFGWWIVEQDEAIGLKIFMSGDSRRAAMFDPDLIISKLKPKISQEGFLSYMEYVVLRRKSESTIHHNMLIQMYAENIARLAADPISMGRHAEVLGNFIKLQEEYLLGLSRPRSHLKSDPICSYRSKLCQLLQSSKLYDSSEVLSKVDKIPELKIEKAILFSRLERQEECIKIMAVELKDYKGAEIFCLNAGVFRNPRRGAKPPVNEVKEALADVDMKKKLFMALLQEYLHMAQDQGGMALTLRLLDSQSSYLELSEVINLVPPYWSVELLQQYLLRSLRRSYHEFKEVQVAKGLSLGENLRINDELYQLYKTQGPVVITADDICHVCGTTVADTVFMRTVQMGHVKLANYSLAYKRIKNAAFDGTGTRSTVLFFVSADVDAICAFRIWATLLKSDCISYVVIPVSEMESVRSQVQTLSSSIRSIIMLNCGGLFNLEDYMEMSEEVTIYVLDSHRPVNLRNAFWNNEVIVFHEGDLDKELLVEKDAIIFTEENEYEPKNGHGGESDDEDLQAISDEDNSNDEDDDDEENDRRQRRRTGMDTEVMPGNLNRKWKEARAIIVDYMSKGTVYGTSVSNQTYMMATQLDRTSADILWLAIVGLTSQYINDYIGHKDYLDTVQIYKDESERLIQIGRQSIVGAASRLDEQNSGPTGVASDEGVIRCTEEYRFMMVRHWSLYESMYHSNYVASRLGIWREPGRKRLQALLAKMGFSLEECNQVFAHMSIDLKKILKDRLESVAPEYGLNEIFYTSFTRSYGYRGLMSASDVVYSITSLLECSPEALVALGYRSEGKGEEALDKGVITNTKGEEEEEAEEPSSWWHSNFFKACDSLEIGGGGGEGDQLRHGLRLCMETQKAIVRQAIAIIEKQVIITLSTCRVATLKDGPDLTIFWNPLTLNKLAQFLVYAIREYGSKKSGYRTISLVLAVLKEETQTFVVTGVHGSPVIGEVIPNKFGIVFEKISYNEGIPVKYLCFNKSVIEIDRNDVEAFMKSIGRYMR